MVIRVIDRGVIKEAKYCLTCKKIMTYRKKWEKCWDEVK